MSGLKKTTKTKKKRTSTKSNTARKAQPTPPASKVEVVQDATTTRREQWQANFEDVAKEGGFFTELGHEHKALFTERSDTLVVVFENLDDARQDSENRMPWGMDYLTSKGWSALGLMAHGPTWYRDPAVLDFFDTLKKEKFFNKFKRVVFYGGSMGGYGATAFSSACPGADVIAVNPQATLSRNMTLGWEPRFKKVWTRDFEGRYGNGAEQIRDAGHVRIFYDPTIREDAVHASLYTGDNVEKIRCRYMGHGMLTTWRHMGVLSKIITGCIEGTASQNEIYHHLRARTRSPFYQKRILNHLLAIDRPKLVSAYCKAVLNDSAPQRRPHFAHAMKTANTRLGR